MRGLNLRDTKKLIKFDTVRENVAQQHALKNEDAVVNMADLRVTPTLNIEVPKVGTFSMTDWAKKQLGSILGVQWDKWFSPKLVDHQRIQEEIQHRFSRTQDQRKLRTMRFRPGAPGVKDCDGYLRAVLSPTYQPIDDERVFDRLERQFGSNVRELSFMNNHLIKKGGWGNDHCSYYTVVGEPVNMGPINLEHPDPHVRQVYELARAENALPEADYVYPGFNFRNSEVGYTAITIDEFHFRLICLNGCMICVGDSRLMYRQHRPIEDGDLDRQLKQVFDRIPVRWELTRKRLVEMQGADIQEPAKAIEDVLKRQEAPKHFIELSIKEFEKEPLKNEYGVLQAITRAAQSFEDADKRFEFEAMAGRLVARGLPRVHA